ncbi:MAG TPA: hypothetical protein VF808_06150 [Ktedonobacterales bacterium]
MATDDDGGYPQRDSYRTDGAGPQARAPGQGPLGARLSQRGRATDAPAFGVRSPYEPFTPPSGQSPYEQGASDPASPTAAPFGTYAPSAESAAPRDWGRVTGALKLTDQMSGALHSGLQFGANWTSRSEMLRACLDEYYRLVAGFNDARRLLELSDGDIEALRRDRMAAAARLRDVEARLEFHSRSELRAVYLGAAEAETRLFRAEEERDLLRNRLELLESFMAFLSRIIATVRAIPPNVALTTDGQGDESQGAARITGAPAAAPVASPNDTLIVRPDLSKEASAALASSADQDFEELVLDEDEVALLPSNEFEIISIVEETPPGAEVNATVGVAPEAPSTRPAGAQTGQGSAGEAPNPVLKGDTP